MEWKTTEYVVRKVIKFEETAESMYTAFCDDGSVWHFENDVMDGWVCVAPPLPLGKKKARRS